jgi:hypothetical protein
VVASSSLGVDVVADDTDLLDIVIGIAAHDHEATGRSKVRDGAVGAPL